MGKRILFIVVLSLISSAALWSLEFKYEGINGEMGFLWKRNEGYDTQEGDSGPSLLTFIPGVSAFFTLDEHLFFRPSLYFYTQTLEYIPERDYTIPVDYSNINSMSVLSFMLQPAAGYRWTLGDKGQHTLGVQAGPGLHFQIPLWGPGDSDRSDMQSVFFKELVYGNVAAWYYNPLTERYGFNFKIETGLPLYNLWVDRDLSFGDGLIVNFQVGIRVIVGGGAEEAPRESSESDTAP